MITIIVPFYCTKKEYFEKCMNSLLSDESADVEVLIVDDGSSDDYLKTLDTYKLDARVTVFYENHQGVSHARNIGIDNASGEWLMFVDSDDYLEHGYASILELLANNIHADIIIFNGYGDKHGCSVKNRYFIEENKDYGISISEKCKVMGAGLSLGRVPEYYRCFYTLGAPYSKLIRTDFIKRNNVRFDESIKFAEDTLFSMNLFLKAEHIIYKDVYLYHYYMNEESVTGKYRLGLSDDMDSFFGTAWKFITENNLEHFLTEAYYIRAFLESQRCIRQEFCHKKNVDKNKYNQAASFISKEPYRTGIRGKYKYMERMDSKIASLLLRMGQIKTYMKTYNSFTMIKKGLAGRKK